MKFTSDSHMKGGRLNKLESFVGLEEDRHSFTSSAGFAAVPRNTIVGGPRQATFTIDVSLRRGRIALLTVVMVGAIVALMRFFQNGYEIRRYSAKPEPALQKELLDTYNSYSGNIVSVFGKPIELRNLVESRAVRAKTVCEQNVTVTMRKPFLMDTVEYGFPQRDWMKKLLPEALSPTTMAITMNPTKRADVVKLKGEDLPMNASIAADLAIYAVILSQDLVPMVGSMADPEYDSRYRGRKYNASAAVRVGILPPDLSASDAVQEQWFVDRVEPYLTMAFNGSSWMTRTNVSTAFSHVQIAPDIAFDAVSLDFDLLPSTLQEFNNSETGDRYMNGGVNVTSAGYNDVSFNCDPWPARCVFKKRDVVIVSPTIDNQELYMDAPAQSTRNGKFDEYLNILPCSRPSTSSMLLVNVGKRLSADVLTQNTTADEAGIRPGGVGTATNVRKTYSLTVGRLSWNTTDIASAFGATCNIATGARCEGLTIALNKTSRDASPQQLVVSADKLPIDALLQPQLNNINSDFAVRQRPLTLVQVYEPTRQQTQELWYDIVAGDILHPHNVRNLTWDLTQKRPGDLCLFEEERVQRVLDNHRYIEYPLQATYTAGVFFLFQDAVVRDTVAVAGRSANATTLAFDGNTQPIALSVSIPKANSLYTQLGCLLLVTGVVISLVWTTIVRHQPDPLTGITNAEVMARVKLDDRDFPQLLLHRHVTLANGTHIERRELDRFILDSLSLREGGDGKHEQQQQPTRDTEADDVKRISAVA